MSNDLNESDAVTFDPKADTITIKFCPDTKQRFKALVRMSGCDMEKIVGAVISEGLISLEIQNSPDSWDDGALY